MSISLIDYRWKSLFGAGHQVHAGWIDDTTERESEILKAYCQFSCYTSNTPSYMLMSVCVLIVFQLLAENHDLQVRFRWNKNDVAIWDKYAFQASPFEICHMKLTSGSHLQSLSFPYCYQVSLPSNLGDWSVLGVNY